eukprot:Gb_40901 [translate_table: standard]
MCKQALPSIYDKYTLVNKPTKGTTPNDTMVNKPIDETTPKGACEKTFMVTTNHLIRGEIREEVITIQALEEIENLVEHNINNTMHAIVEEKNQYFKLMEELTQSSSSWRIMLHQQNERPRSLN